MSIWTDHVLPHGSLEQITPLVWTVCGRLPRGNMPRNMVVHRLPDRSLLIHSAIALDDVGIKAIESLGEPKVMVVPNGLHRLDAVAWKKRYPKIRVLCPAAARAKVEQRVEVDATCEDFLPLLKVHAQAVPGIKPGELAYELEAGTTNGGRVLVVTDMLFNLPNLAGFDGGLLRVLGSTGFFGMTRIGRLFMLTDRASFQSWLEAQAKRTDVAAICVGHGDPVRSDVGMAIASAAERLSRL